MYHHLQVTYNWTPSTIDEQDFYRTFEIERADHARKKSSNLGEELVYIDQLGF